MVSAAAAVAAAGGEGATAAAGATPPAADVQGDADLPQPKARPQRRKSEPSQDYVWVEALP